MFDPGISKEHRTHSMKASNEADRRASWDE